MGLQYLLKNIRNRYQTQDFRDATVDNLHEVYIGGLRRIESIQDPKYENHWERDWDILCILDACRDDMFRNACTDHDWLPSSDSVDSIYSSGSTSREWMGEMFSPEFEKEMSQTAYITGNRFVEKIDTSFAHLDVHSPRFSEKNNAYTVQPEDLTDAAIRYWRNRNPDVNKLIIHYMQPHTPFRDLSNWFEGLEPRTGWGKGFAELRDGQISKSEFLSAYRDNLDWVLCEIDRLRQNIDGTLALSADHGNGLGEWGVYGHPEGINVGAVREVPFATIEATDTKQCIPDPPSGSEELNEDVDKHLRDLGYKM